MKQKQNIGDKTMPKKQLSEKDKALLAARGIKKFNTVSSTTPYEFNYTNKKAKKSAPKKDKNPNSKHELVGKILHTSWGCDMTINDFCKILEVSPTGKTVKCQMVNVITNGEQYGPGGSGKAKASHETHGPVFRLKVRGNGYFNGSYPFCNGSKRMGYFSIDNGREYYENRWD